MNKHNILAVSALEGHTLPNGWRVVRLLKPAENATGSCHSVAYVVEKDGVEGFLKAFDFTSAFDHDYSIERLSNFIAAYKHERDLVTYCNQKRLRKVVVAIDSGEFRVPNYDPMPGTVYYLIFHLADGDVRKQPLVNNRYDTLWSLRALKDVATGLFQIHQQMIAHQDVKPSNVLTFGNEFRIGDFGRASRKGMPAVHDGFRIAGDPTYAPPEQKYGHESPDFTPRRIGCDLYMFGNLAAYMFTGINITAKLLSTLKPEFHPNEFGGVYEDALPYVVNAFAEVMDEVKCELDGRIRSDIAPMIEQLCHPDLKKRGHPRVLGRGNQYSVERYISLLDRVIGEFCLRARTPSR